MKFTPDSGFRVAVRSFAGAFFVLIGSFTTILALSPFVGGTMRRNAVRIAVLALTGLALNADRASAQGFGVYEHDACAMGRAGTGVAAPELAVRVFPNRWSKHHVKHSQ